MVGLVSYWSVHPWITAHKGGPKHWMSLYTYALQAFGGTDFILIGRDIPQYENHDVNFKVYSNLESVLKAYPKMKIVVLVDWEAKEVEPIELKDYKHPKGDTLYIVGSNYGDINFKGLKKYKCDYVTIKTPVRFPGVWAHIWSSIALRDRYIKEGN